MIHCLRCDAPPLEVERVEAVGLGRCRPCQLVFDLDEVGRRTGPASRDPRALRRVAAPGKLEAWQRDTRAAVAYRGESGSREMTIRQPWRGTLSVGTTSWFLLALGLDVLLAFVLAGIGASKTRGTWIPGGLLGFFGGLSPMIYATTANHYNRSELVARGGHLTVTHGPLPWFWRKVSLTAREIDQVFVEARRHEDIETGHVTFTYDVRVCTRGARKDVMLVRGLEDMEIALFLEEQIEDTLGISDRDVGGFMRGDRPRPKLGG